MPFQITVTGATLEECVIELVNTARNISLGTPQVPVEQPAPAPAEPTPVTAPVTAPAPVKLDAEALRTEIRAVLAPLMSQRGAEIKALLNRYGATGLSSVEEDSLPALLSDAKEMARG